MCSQNGVGIVLAGGLGGYVYLKSKDTKRAETAFECAPSNIPHMLTMGVVPSRWLPH